MKAPRFETVTLDKIVGGGQALGTLEDGRKAFVWGGLPGEKVTIRVTKKKSHFVEGIVTEVLQASSERIAPLDPESYLSTSPWQIMTFEAEQHYKAALIEEAFELHDIVLPDLIIVYTDNRTAHYRNKVEFSWYGQNSQVLKKDVLRSEFLVLSEKNDGSSNSQRRSAAASFDEDSAFPAAARQETPVDNQYAPSGSETKEAAVLHAAQRLDLAFFQRGSKGKIIVDQCSLLPEPIMRLAREIRGFLEAKQVSARQLKSLLIRCDQQGNCVWQLYIKEQTCEFLSEQEAASFDAQGGEVIYSDPRSPASRITQRLLSVGNVVLTDHVLGVPFSYATEGFFQVNIPTYEQALKDMQQWVSATSNFSETSADAQKPNKVGDDERGSTHISSPYAKNVGADSSAGPAPSDLRETSKGSFDDGSGKVPVIDLYSGVGSIGLTIGGDNCTLVEIDENAVREMKRNIKQQGSSAQVVLAPSEKALEHISSDHTVIVDPPRAGLHQAVVERLLEVTPPRIIYLSCNPVTQARDVAMLAKKYGIRTHKGYNFFPRTPHIEHLVILERRESTIVSSEES